MTERVYQGSRIVVDGRELEVQTVFSWRSATGTPFTVITATGSVPPGEEASRMGECQGKVVPFSTAIRKSDEDRAFDELVDSVATVWDGAVSSPSNGGPGAGTTGTGQGTATVVERRGGSGTRSPAAWRGWRARRGQKRGAERLRKAYQLNVLLGSTAVLAAIVLVGYLLHAL